jgi:hypothetical protein
MDHQDAIAATRRWIADMVIGLNLCPFARRVFEADAIRYVVTEAEDEEALRNDLAAELRGLVEAPIAQIETTLLIHPRALLNFLDYNDFLDVADQLLGDLGLVGIVQIAGFHPQYQFADAEPDAAENYTNRSPFPMLHLLREESIATSGPADDELLEIPKRNIETLRAIGRAKILDKLKAIISGRSQP